MFNSSSVSVMHHFLSSEVVRRFEGQASVSEVQDPRQSRFEPMLFEQEGRTSQNKAMCVSKRFRLVLVNNPDDCIRDPDAGRGIIHTACKADSDMCVPTCHSVPFRSGTDVILLGVIDC